MSRKITIVGGGQAGLVLGIGLLDAGYKVRLVQNRTAADIASGKVMSTQCIFGAARAQERALGLDLWDDAAPAVTGVRVTVAAPDAPGNKAFEFIGKLAAPAQSVDQRIKFPRFMELIAERGGTIEIAEAGTSDIERYAAESDLVIIAAGKGPASELFERDPQRSPNTTPMRALSLAYAEGVIPHPAKCVTANIVPGIGEVFMLPALTRTGPCEILFMEGIIGGPFDVFDQALDAGVQLERIKMLIKRFLPWEFERVSRAVPTDPNAGLFGRLTPTVRKGVGVLPSGRPVLGLADAVVLNDPIAGQGSNNAIRAATVYLAAIKQRGAEPYDADWMRETFEAGYAQVEASTQFSNMLLMPPPPHVSDLLGRASARQDLADLVAGGFDRPETLVPVLADPKRAAAA